MGNNLDAITTVFTEFYYWVTVVFMFLIHVGFCLYEVAASRRRNHLHTLMKNTMLIPLVTVTWFFFGCKANNTDIYETFRAMGDALREYFSRHGPTPLYVVVGRGGPNLVRGLGTLAETCEALGLPFRFFGFDSAISEVVNYAKRVDAWMRAGGRAQIAARLGLKEAA